MKQDEAKRIIQDCLENTYNSINFDRLIANILTTPYQIINNKVWEAYVREAFRDSISSYVVKGIYEDSSSKRIAILEVQLRSDTSLQHARTMQRNFVADFLKWGNNYGRQDGALVAFVWPEGHDWRFSLVKMEYSLEVKEGKIKTQENLTPAKRWSFLVGKNEKSHTAQSRFLPLVMEESHGAIFAEIENAFDVESVTDEFFEQYKECFFRFKDEIDRVIALNDRDRAHFESIGLDTANFAKKTLGQIAFLYFLQKKGWFGVASDKKWWEWPKDFLRKLFERREKYGKNFFNDVLEPLFYEALATDRWELAIYTRLNNTRVPFLNGGLFEPMKGYEWEKTDLTINDEVFSNDHKTKNGDIGDGIFDVFDRYNFTVSEDEPLEKEVAVDPEMLGKIFENLLEIRDRKSKWAFYTPRPIVHYMCQESLIEYLSNIDISIAREDIEFFIRESEVTLENDKTTKRKIEESKEKWREYRGDYAFKTPASIREKAKELDQALSDIRIADPAVGSGAFPLGMINEIVRARQILAVHTGSKTTPYQLKLHAIQENIYGVDLEPGAVEICQLRLWLSLIVDETIPHPLPNLNYRIMQGNSLIEEYEWIKLYDAGLLSAEKKKRVEQMTMDSLMNSESNRLYELLQSKLKKFINTSGRTEKNSLKQEIDELKFWLIEATLREQGKEEKISEIHRLREANITPFFLWKLEFSEVFQEKWGFDVVIGNPPYVWEKWNKDVFRPIAESSLGKRFHLGKMDLFYFFFHLGLDLLSNNGVLGFITTNYYITATSALKLRKDICDRWTILQLLNFNELKIFPSALGQHNIISMVQKGKTPKLAKTLITKHQGYSGQETLTNILQGTDFKTDYYSLKQEEIYSKGNIKLTKGMLDNILDRIESECISMKEFFDINEWIQTWANEVFLFDSYPEFYEQLNQEEKSLFRPFYKNSDIKKYQISMDKMKYILYIDNTFNIEGNVPEIKKYLESKIEVLSNRAQIKRSNQKWYTLLWPRNVKLFENEAIVTSYRPNSVAFGYKDSSFYSGTDTYYITNPQDWYSLKFILGIINSLVASTWFFNRGKVKGKILEMTGDNIEKLPIPKITPSNQILVNEIETISEMILSKKQENPRANTNEFEWQIDRLVYKLYDLTDEEIKIIEGK